MKTRRVTLPIDDLSCGGGGALAQTSGVVYVYVSPATEMAYIVYNPSLTDPNHLIQVVEHSGFHAGTPRLR
jgi:hypothetical protein